MTPQQPPPTLTNPPILVKGIKIFQFCKKGVKVYTIYYLNQLKTKFRPRPPPLALMTPSLGLSHIRVPKLQRESYENRKNLPQNDFLGLKTGTHLGKIIFQNRMF